ncbi:hypothetical protein LX32DRAFT_698610 [Colletotrichum zoysiae]|uniref:Uncharacterized protein n=1 Tax=Colletotrichum zoysiae TaxID=1216348 RepID=A0AAD9H4X7_9PEZI|nr:hypothetical protein LX32DRAFT_698610 [Colletotrichum zoysiae]
MAGFQLFAVRLGSLTEAVRDFVKDQRDFVKSQSDSDRLQREHNEKMEAMMGCILGAFSRNRKTEGPFTLSNFELALAKKGYSQHLRLAILSSVLDGMMSFTFTAADVSGMAILVSQELFNCRNWSIPTLLLTYDYVCTYAGDNCGVRRFLNAIVPIMETDFAFVCMVLNLFLDQEMEDMSSGLPFLASTFRPFH